MSKNKVKPSKISVSASRADLATALQELIDLKREKNVVITSKALSYQKYKGLVGEEQELSRQINQKLDSLDELREK